jgi:pimeloyl-ACP methyl ester carboxylesterase
MEYAQNHIDGTTVAFDVVGHGPDLVLLHGMAGSSKMWQSLGYVDALRSEYRLVLIDARGHGQSAKPHDPALYAVERYAGDIGAVLDALEVEKAHLFGYSMGARIAIATSVLQPHRIKSLIAGGGTAGTEAGWFDRLIFPGAVDTIASQGMETFLREWESRLGSFLPDPVRQMYLTNDVEAIVACLRASDEDSSFLDRLGSVAAPALLFAGEHDDERREPTLEAAVRLRGAEAVIIPGTNHVTTLTRTDLVLPLVRRFLGAQAIAASTSSWVGN